jgi:hypothetical protein
LCKEFLQIEILFLRGLFSNLCTAAIFNGNLDRHLDTAALIRQIRLKEGAGPSISKVGQDAISNIRLAVSGLAQLDQQPIRSTTGSRAQDTTEGKYLQHLPILLTSSIAVDASKSLLEGVAFVLIAYGHFPFDANTDLTFVEAATKKLRQMAPNPGNTELININNAAADYMLEMVDTMRLWRLYYSVYRPLLALDTESPPDEQNSAVGTTAGTGPSLRSADVESRQTTAMDQVASAAQAISGGLTHRLSATLTETNAEARTGDQAGIYPSMDDLGSVAGTEEFSAALEVGDMYNMGIPFDLEIFLKDIDQLF